MKRIKSPGRSWKSCRVLLSLAFIIFIPALFQAQSSVEPAQPSSEAAQSSPAPARLTLDPAKSSEGVQSRIHRARALIAAHQLSTAVSELESIRATTKDFAIRNITSVMLMSVYLEEGNYARAEALLEENFQSRSEQKDESIRTYFALAGQAVNGARMHLARYRSFGINTTDSLPVEAVKDLDRLRSLLERMIAQAKEVSKDRKAYDSLSLLEDVLGIRLSLAKGSEDQTRWRSEYASAREMLASSEIQIASLGGIPPLRRGKAALNKVSSPSPYSTGSMVETTSEKREVSGEQQHSNGLKTPSQSMADSSRRSEESQRLAPNELEVSNAGALNARATKRVDAVYPNLAKQNGAAGLVRVYVIIDEKGRVVDISRSEGPMLLRQAAENAARQWFFEGISAEVRPARISGYIDFNFSL